MEMNPQLAALPAVKTAERMAEQACTHAELMSAVLAYDAHPTAAATPAVPGRAGSRAPANPLMLLGKSPAANETRLGLPYQGQAAQVLRKAIEEAGFDIEDTHQTHATYWRPPKDNLPNATQIAFSRPFITREIEIVRPRRIVALGAKAADSMFGDHPEMDEDAAIELEWNGIPVTILRNHGFISRFPRARPSFVEGLRRAWKA